MKGIELKHGLKNKGKVNEMYLEDKAIIYKIKSLLDGDVLENKFLNYTNVI